MSDTKPTHDCNEQTPEHLAPTAQRISNLVYWGDYRIAVFYNADGLTSPVGASEVASLIRQSATQQQAIRELRNLLGDAEKALRGASPFIGWFGSYPDIVKACDDTATKIEAALARPAHTEGHPQPPTIT